MPFKISIRETKAGDSYGGDTIYEQTVDTIDIPTLVRLINPESGPANTPESPAEKIAAINRAAAKRASRGA